MRKRALFVALIAVIMVFGMVSMAYAAATSGYAAWTSGGVNAGTAATPHKDYRTTTVKCAVCHAVHKANPAGELLLDGTAGESCLYCHVDGATGLVRIYNGTRTDYTTNNQFSHGDNGSGTSVGSRCTDCHAVHGANTINNATVDKFILKSTAAASNGPGGVASQQAEAAAAAALAPADKQAQVDAFCSMCHPYAQYSYNGTITVGNYRASGIVQNGVFQSHVMTAATAAYANPKRSIASTRVAWIGSEHCRQCHDAGEVDTQSSRAIVGAGAGYVVLASYPHYTPNYTRFLMSADSSTSAFGQTTYVPAGGAASTMTDGVCLKCHRGASAPATTGIGYNF